MFFKATVLAQQSGASEINIDILLAALDASDVDPGSPFLIVWISTESGAMLFLSTTRTGRRCRPTLQKPSGHSMGWRTSIPLLCGRHFSPPKKINLRSRKRTFLKHGSGQGRKTGPSFARIGRRKRLPTKRSEFFIKFRGRNAHSRRRQKQRGDPVPQRELESNRTILHYISDNFLLSELRWPGCSQLHPKTLSGKYVRNRFL